MPLCVGTRLGPYEILAPLGAGGMGEVYRGDLDGHLSPYARTTSAEPAAPNIGQKMVTIDNLAQFLNENRHGFHAMAEMELLCCE